MPKDLTCPSSPIDVKPYLVTSASRESKPKPPPKPPAKPKTTSGRNRPWTDAERLTLFDIAIRQGSSLKAFEGKIGGRTAKQCCDTWNNTVKPLLRRFLGAH